VNAYHEPLPNLYRFSKLSYWYAEDQMAQDIFSEGFLAMRSDLLHHALAHHKGYVETSPQATFLAPSIVQTIPQVKFIHLVRNPKDVVRSGMRRKWYDGHRLDKNRITPVPGSKLHERWLQYSPFQKNLWLWNETNRWILNFLTTVPPHSKILIHAEDIFAASPDALKRIFDFIHASLPSERKIRRVLGRRLNAQQSGVFPEFEQWDSNRRKILIEMCGDTANQLGYHI